MDRRRLLLALGFSAAIGVAGRSRGALSSSGAIGAILVGSPVFYGGGSQWAATLLAFFGSSSALSHLQRRERMLSGPSLVEVRGSQRDIVQALANGGIAAIAAALRPKLQTRAVDRAFAGSLAAANADTWATEIGKTSPTPPHMILSGAVATAGTSGAVSPRGLLASICGSAAIAAVAASGRSQQSRATAFGVITLAGVLGSLADSVAGATIQAAYQCPLCHKPTERRTHACGAATTLVSGHAWCTNDVVNIICTLTGALAANALAWLWRAEVRPQRSQGLSRSAWMPIVPDARPGFA